MNATPTTASTTAADVPTSGAGVGRTTGTALAALTVVGAVVGGWALLAPASFYLDFPGSGRQWVSPDGPYNEHLVRDVGALYLALGVVAAAGLLRADRATATVAGLAWLVFSVPHLAYHAEHLDPFATSDAVLQLVTLGATVVLAAVLVGAPPARPAARPSARSRRTAGGAR